MIGDGRQLKCASDAVRGWERCSGSQVWYEDEGRISQSEG
jgi:hypothetical protein